MVLKTAPECIMQNMSPVNMHAARTSARLKLNQRQQLQSDKSERMAKPEILKNAVENCSGVEECISPI
jgi:hypothetical protein